MRDGGRSRPPASSLAIHRLLWRDGRPTLVVRLAALALVLPPLIAFLWTSPAATRLGSVIPALAAFIGISIWALSASSQDRSRRALVAGLLLTPLAVLVSVLDPRPEWLILFYYPAVATGLVGALRRAAPSTMAVAGIAATASWLALGDLDTLFVPGTGYLGWRAGIEPGGSWVFFVAGD